MIVYLDNSRESVTNKTTEYWRYNKAYKNVNHCHLTNESEILIYKTSICNHNKR